MRQEQQTILQLPQKNFQRDENIMLKLFEIAGITGILLIIVLLIFLPIIVTFVVGIAFANLFHFTGITWWCFIILFYLIISAIFGILSK